MNDWNVILSFSVVNSISVLTTDIAYNLMREFPHERE